MRPTDGNGKGDASSLARDDLENALRVGFSADDEGDERPAPGAVSRILLRDLPGEDAPLSLAATDHRDADGFDRRYEVLGEIARGAVGVIYKAHDRQLGRDLALKVLRKDRVGNKALIERFVEEAQVEGQLQHPGIVPVYGIGLHADGRPYIAMKLVKGRTLSALLRDRRDHTESRRRFLGLFERLCQAVGYAHAREVVHRDLKPSNVLVGAFGEVQVVDWGFAKVLGARVEEPSRPAPPPDRSVIRTLRTGSEGSESMAGSIMGTPAYMPPEQALGLIESIGARSDVFALGAILCEILTGQPPYVGDSEDLLPMAAAARQEDAHARIASCGADEELQQLCVQALSPHSRDRPADATELAKTVTRYLAALEEQARRAEVHAAEQRARAEEKRLRAASDRRARRRTAGIATVLLGTVALTAGWAHTRSSKRLEREARAAQDVDAWVATAERAAAARDVAGALSGLKEALANAATAGVPVEALARAAALRMELSERLEREAAEREQAEKDRRMVETLERIGLTAVDDSDFERMDRAFSAAFAEYGVPLSAPDVEEAASAIRDSAVTDELVGALELWIGNHPSWADETRRPERERLDALVTRADPDPFRAKIRAAVKAEDKDALVELAARADDLPPRTAWVLGIWLHALGARDEAEAVIRRTAARNPRDIYLAGQIITFSECHGKNDGEDGIRYAMASAALTKDSVAASYAARIATTLDGEARLNEAKERFAEARVWHEQAERLSRSAIETDPTDPIAHARLGAALRSLGKLDEAVAALQKAVEPDRDDERAWGWLATVERVTGNFDGALRAYREAQSLAPRNDCLHRQLATMQLHAGDYDGAKRSIRQALSILVANAENEALGLHGHNCFRALNNAACTLGDADLEVEITERACDVWPDADTARMDHGGALLHAGRKAEAAAVYRAVIASPSAPPSLVTSARWSLAHSLLCFPDPQEFAAFDFSDPDGVIAEAVKLMPGERSIAVMVFQAYRHEAHGELDEAAALYKWIVDWLLNRARNQLKFREVATAARSEDDGGEREYMIRLSFDKPLVEESVRFYEAKAALFDRLFLPTVHGEAQPVTADEHWVVAQMEWWRGRNSAAVPHIRKALALDPMWHRYPSTAVTRAQIACDAAAGWDRTPIPATGQQRTDLRRYALSELRTALDVWRQRIRENPSPHVRMRARSFCATMQRDHDPKHLLGVKRHHLPYPGRTDDLPPDEKAEWDAFWVGVREFMRSTWNGGTP